MDLRQDVPPRLLDGEQPGDVVVIVDVASLGHGGAVYRVVSGRRGGVSAEPVVAEQVLQVPAEVVPDVVALQGELDRRLEVVELVADVVAPAIEPVGVERPALARAG